MGACSYGVERRAFSRSGESGQIHYQCYTKKRRTVGLGGLRVGENRTSLSRDRIRAEQRLDSMYRYSENRCRTRALLRGFAKPFQGWKLPLCTEEGSDVGNLSPLIISTTHQLLRYKEAFDVIIIDEVDAFPYSIDNTLQYAVKKSAKRQSAHIYLTATPSADMKKGLRAESWTPSVFPRDSTAAPCLNLH